MADHELSKRASLALDRKVFLIPFCLGILIATYGLLRLTHPPFPFAASRVLRILEGVATAAVSWVLSSRPRAAKLTLERKPYTVPFYLGLVLAVYALSRLGHGPSPFGRVRILKVVAGFSIAAASWFLSSKEKVRDAQDRLSNFRQKIFGVLNCLKGYIAVTALKTRQLILMAFTNFAAVGVHVRVILEERRKEKATVSAVVDESTPRKNRLQTFLLWLAFSALVLWLGPFSNYSPSGAIDPWLYTGYFRNFHDLVNRFGLLYYPSRLPYLLFGVLMYKVFSPLAANYLINVTILSIDCFALYAILSCHAGRGVAAVTTIALACNPYLISTISSDYPDGPAIAFLLLGCWMMIAPPRSCEGNLATVLTGAFWALAGYTNLIAGLIIIPGMVILFYTKRVDPKEAVRQCAWLAVGVAAVTFIFGLISVSVFHTFVFWMAQWRVFQAVTTKGYFNPATLIGFEWIPRSFQLAATYGLTLVGGVFFIRHFRKLRGDRFFLGALLFLLLSDLVFAYVEFGMKAIVLRIYYCNSYMLVPLFIFLGAFLSALGRIVGNEGKGWFRVGLAMALVGALLPLCNINVILSLSRQQGLYWVILLVISVVGLTAACLPGRSTRLGIVVAAFCFALLVSSSCSYFNNVFVNNRWEFKAAIATQDLLETGLIEGRPFLFWYDSNEQWSPLYMSIHSLYLWGWRDLTRELPTMSVPELQYQIRPDTVIIHLTTAPEKIPQRERLLTTRNLKVENIGCWTVQRGDIEFKVYAQHVLNASELK